MMLKGEICGFGGKAYDFKNDEGKQVKGTTWRVSFCVGDYESSEGLTSMGKRYFEYKCSENLVGSIELGNNVLLEIDEESHKVRSSLLEVEGGMYIPIELL